MAVAFTTHRIIEPDENHGIVSRAYADETARLADADWTIADIGRVTRQLSDNSFWWIYNVIPSTPNAIFWSQLQLFNIQTNAESPTMLIQLTPNTTQSSAYMGEDFTDFAGTVLKTSVDAGWDAGTKKLVFVTAGYYRVTIDSRMVPVDPYYLLQDCAHGAYLEGALSVFNRSIHTSNNNNSGYLYTPTPRLTWHDEFYVNATALQQAQIALYFNNQGYTGYGDVSLDAVVSVQKLL